MDKLIAELEAATEGSEVLDVAICKAIYNYGPDDPPWYVLPYSRDLAAGKTLLQEGWCWGVSGYGPSDMFNPNGGQAFTHKAGEHYQHADVATEELALVVVALKARQEMEPA